MKQNHHFIVPRDRFVLETGTSLISTYTFNTHAAKSGNYIKISQPNVNTWNLDINFVLSVESRVSTFQDLTRTELVWCLTASPLAQLETKKLSTSRGTIGRTPSSLILSSRKCPKTKERLENMSIQRNCNYQTFFWQTIDIFPVINLNLIVDHCTICNISLQPGTVVRQYLTVTSITKCNTVTKILILCSVILQSHPDISPNKYLLVKIEIHIL